VAFNATGTSSTPPATANVTVRDNFFDPSSVIVAVGGTVTWTCAGAVAHNVTLPSAAGTSPTQSSGTFSHTFTTAGSVTYQCTIHSGMQATVVVQ
jgi:plastocyanin